MMTLWTEIERACDRLKGVAHRTPVFHSSQFDRRAGCEVFFKAENLQRAGSFKFRGAYNRIRAETEKHSVRSIVAASSGNHAQAVALSAGLLGIQAAIVMPLDAPRAKVEATRAYGAEIILYDRYAEDRDSIAQKLCAERGALAVPAFDDFLVMAGQGTAAVELMEEVPDLDCLLAPVSGNGLMAGCATAAAHLRPGTRIFGVEPEAANDTFLSFRKGERVSIPVPHTLADGLQMDSPGRLTFPIVKALLEDVLLVSEEEMVETLLFFLERMKLLVEPSGAVAAAAVRHGKADFSGLKVGVILSGGNVDGARLAGFLSGSVKKSWSSAPSQEEPLS
jgi:threonine dehydratase